MGPTKRKPTKTGEALLAIMKKRNMGTNALAASMGKDVPITRISERIYQKNISVKNLDEMAKAMAYKIMLVPIDTKANDDFFEIGSDDE